jgi:predicted RND superfamily exporter protein
VLFAAATATALGGWLLLPQLPIEAQPDVLAAGLPALSEAQHIENVVGSSGEVQVVLRGPDVLTPAALAWMRSAQDAITVNYGDKLRPIVSLPDLLGFLGRSPTPEQVGAAMATLPPYLTGAAVSFDHHAAVIQLGMRLQDLHDQQRLLDGLAHMVPAPPSGYHSQIVGLPVAASRAYDLLSTDRYLSNSLGIILAGLVLLLRTRATRAIAPQAVSAALLATGWGLAVIWLLEAPLTPLTVALGSLSTATASEFTLMLGASHQGAPPRRTVGVAALAACLGYGALALSRLHILRDFGLLLSATVLLSLSAAYLVVPALPPRPTRTENLRRPRPGAELRERLRRQRLSKGAT